MPNDGRRSPERRDTSPTGTTRRARVQQSLDLLDAFGLSPSAIEYYQRLGRASRRLPHEVAREIMEAIAQDLSEHSANPSGTALKRHTSLVPTGLM
jgi:hypothetical protein